MVDSIKAPSRSNVMGILRTPSSLRITLVNAVHESTGTPATSLITSPSARILSAGKPSLTLPSSVESSTGNPVSKAITKKIPMAKMKFIIGPAKIVMNRCQSVFDSKDRFFGAICIRFFAKTKCASSKTGIPLICN